MIVKCKSGAQVVIGECTWVRDGGAVYLSVMTATGATGAAMVDRKALATVRAELDRIDALLAERAQSKQRRRKAANE
jgi:hypothetical protein